MASTETCASKVTATAAVPTKTSGSHGVKRSAPDNLENDQRLAKRFDLLNLDHGGKLFIPVDSTTLQQQSTKSETEQSPARHRRSEDLMQVDDSAHRVYIYDLDEELAEVESDEDTPIFLPDIEKHLNRIPQHVLQDPSHLKPTNTNQVVLYNIPSSLTVPKEQDNVRKAIIEARARVKERQALNPGVFMDQTHANTPPRLASSTHLDVDDSDRMEVEVDL